VSTDWTTVVTNIIGDELKEVKWQLILLVRKCEDHRIEEVLEVEL
jgi:hypothetical protein